jgi:hypothetical protein
LATKSLNGTVQLHEGIQVQHHATVAVVLVMTLTPSSGSGAEPAFQADRDHFFTKCAVLSNYDMSSKSEVVKKGQTTLTPAMKSGIGVLFDIWEHTGDGDKRRLAFILATARRESRGTFESIREAPGCRDNETCRERAIGNELARRAGTKSPPPNYAMADPKTGLRYYGRGFIQLTHRADYERTGTRLGINLVDDPDKVLDLKIAGEILVRGMLEGWYGNHRPLSYYINGPKTDWIGARDNVNPGSPHKAITAAYARDLNGCLISRAP